MDSLLAAGRALAVRVGKRPGYSGISGRHDPPADPVGLDVSFPADRSRGYQAFLRPGRDHGRRGHSMVYRICFSFRSGHFPGASGLLRRFWREDPLPSGIFQRISADGDREALLQERRRPGEYSFFHSHFYERDALYRRYLLK